MREGKRADKENIKGMLYPKGQEVVSGENSSESRWNGQSVEKTREIMAGKEQEESVESRTAEGRENPWGGKRVEEIPRQKAVDGGKTWRQLAGSEGEAVRMRCKGMDGRGGGCGGGKKRCCVALCAYIG